MKFLFSLLLLVAFVSTLSSQQSLFDKALRIDSLYDQIRGGQTELADQVFAELRDLYPEGEDLTDDAIYSDVSGQNSYLAPKMNYVHNFLEDNQVQADSTMAILKRTFNELIEMAARKAENACAEAGYGTEEEDNPCPFGISIRSLREYPSAKQLAYLRSRIDVNTFAALIGELKAIEIQLYEIDVQLDLLKRQDAAALRLSGSDGGIGLPVGGSADVGQAFGPIVVQSGGGSVQGALIDGASRWIAERMREELSIAFFDRFEIWMEEQNMASLFPSTVRALDITSTTDYSLMMQVLRSAFERDLEELPFNIGPFIRQEINNEEDMAEAEKKANSLYQLEKDEDWLGKMVVDDPTKVGGLLNELSLFTERMDNMQQQYAALRATGQANLGNPQLIGLIRHSLTVLKPVFSMALDGQEEKLNRIQDLSEGILDAYTGVLEQDYDAVVLNVIPNTGCPRQGW